MTKMRTLVCASAIATAVMLTGCVDNAGTSSGNGTQITEVTPEVQKQIDAKFDELMGKMEAIDKADDATAEMMATDFSAIATDMNKYTASGDMKANIGYIVAEMMSLNKSPKIKKLVDSLEVYFDSYPSDVTTGGVEEIYVYNNSASRGTYKKGDNVRGICSQIFKGRSKSRALSNAYKENGVDGLSMSLMARTPEMILRASDTPSFPRFATISYVQDCVESEVMPKINNVITALERVESMSANKSVELTFDGEIFKIDVAEFYLVDASVRALRHSLNLYTAYNYDILDPVAKDNSWIDNLSNYSGTEFDGYVYDLMKFNMGRPEFLSISRANHATAYSDLKAIPVKLRSALEALKKEEGQNTENDVLRFTDLSNLNAEMVDIAADMREEGISPEMAANFASPANLITFAEKVITGPYTVTEKVSGNGITETISFTVDLSKFYTNPIQDMKTILPKYKFFDKNIYLASEDFPFYLLKDNGAELTWDEIDMEGTIPYFNDYTFNGIFPGMTRDSWQKMVDKLINAL